MTTDIVMRNRVISLAGIFQAVTQVGAVAHKGQADNDTVDACLQSLFSIDADSVEQVYPSLAALKPGLQALSTRLQHPEDPEATRYAVALMHHAGVLLKRSDLSDQLQQGVRHAEQRLQHYPASHPNIVAGLADLYTNTISTISPRIMVRGDPRFLSRPELANLVRALLLAGLRSAVLWRQCGGSRLNLLLGRRQLLDAATRVLAEISTVC